MAEQMGRPALSPTELSKIQNVTKNTISSHLRSLEAQGYITRTLHEKDRRQFLIQLSEQGRELIRTTTPRYIGNLNQITSDLSSEEIEQLQTLLQKLLTSLTLHGNLPDLYGSHNFGLRKSSASKGKD